MSYRRDVINNILGVAVVILVLATVVFVAVTSVHERNKTIAGTELVYDEGSVVKVIHKGGKTSRHRLVIKYRYTDYEINVPHSIEKQVEEGASVPLIATVTHHNDGRDVYEIKIDYEGWSIK